jgi:hypothetical protein
MQMMRANFFIMSIWIHMVHPILGLHFNHCRKNPPFSKSREMDHDCSMGERARLRAIDTLASILAN